MKRLPVFEVVGRALRFVFVNMFTLLRLTWLPVAVVLATIYGLAFWLVSRYPDAPLDAIIESDTYLVVSYFELFLEMLAFSVVAVAVHKIILLGERRPGVFFAFPFRRTEALYVVMAALSFAIVLGLMGGAIGIASLTHTGGDLDAAVNAMLSDALPTDERGDPTPAGYVALITAMVLAIWSSCRLMLWPPAIVANNRLSLGEALRLSRGRVWVIIGLTIVMLFPIAALLLVVPSISYAMGAHHDVNILAAFDFEFRLTAAYRGLITPNTIVFDFAFQFLFTTYIAAVLSYAYKALKGFDAEAPLDERHDDEDAPADDTSPASAH